MDRDVREVKTRYLGYVKKVKENGDRFIRKHWEQIGKGSDRWRFPRGEDICEVDVLQIKVIRPESSWDCNNSTAHVLLLQNYRLIDNAIKPTEITKYEDWDVVWYNCQGNIKFISILKWMFCINSKIISWGQNMQYNIRAIRRDVMCFYGYVGCDNSQIEYAKVMYMSNENLLVNLFTNTGGKRHYFFHFDKFIALALLKSGWITVTIGQERAMKQVNCINIVLIES